MQCQRRTDTSFGCPLVGRRDLERRQAMHRDKVQRMKPAIDIKPPTSQPHLTLYGRDYVSKKRATTEAAFSDLKMIQSIAKTMTRKPEIPERKGPVSLNADARKSEIFRIMKENHRLLDRLETLEPIVSTADMIKDHKYKQRYTILVSHSKRLAGEYDDDVMRIRTEDKAKTDEMNRSVQVRLTKYRMANSGSMSMPSLTPLAATDPGVVTNPQASPAPKKRIVKPLEPAGGQPTSNPSYPSASSMQPPAAPPSNQEGKGGKGQVSFLSGEETSPTDAERSQWQRQGGPTPHPKKIPSEMFFDEPVDEEEAAPATEQPAAEAEPAAEDPAVGLGGASSPDGATIDKLGETQDPDASYEADFADETEKIDESGTFEASAS